jgi:hypothetical protein
LYKLQLFWIGLLLREAIVPMKSSRAEARPVEVV